MIYGVVLEHIQQDFLINKSSFLESFTYTNIWRLNLDFMFHNEFLSLTKMLKNVFFFLYGFIFSDFTSYDRKASVLLFLYINFTYFVYWITHSCSLQKAIVKIVCQNFLYFFSSKFKWMNEWIKWHAPYHWNSVTYTLIFIF